jgi:GAG-pre-integrase domain
VSKLRTNPGYNNSLNSTATNQWSKQAIKAYKAFIPAEYELHEKRQHISIASTMDEAMEEQPQLNRCDLEEELLLWHQRFAHMPINIL